MTSAIVIDCSLSLKQSSNKGIVIIIRNAPISLKGMCNNGMNNSNNVKIIDRLQLGGRSTSRYIWSFHLPLANDPSVKFDKIAKPSALYLCFYVTNNSSLRHLWCKGISSLGGCVHNREGLEQLSNFSLDCLSVCSSVRVSCILAFNPQVEIFNEL